MSKTTLLVLPQAVPVTFDWLKTNTPLKQFDNIIYSNQSSVKKNLNAQLVCFDTF